MKCQRLLEKHTPGWNQEEEQQQEEGPSRWKPEQAEKAKEKTAGKGKEKSGKKTTCAKEPVETEPVA